MTTELAVKQDAQLMESVLLQGDLSKLTPAQRVNYYRKVCESMGLNPLTRPFDYLNLKGKLVLYAKKDATDQLRNIQGVSIDDVDINETATQFIVKVKGHNSGGRTDVEIGVVNKTDMQGDLANAQMKAVTKGKRRLTLSLCGLGWLDETEVETIPGAKTIPSEEVDAIAEEVKPERPYTPEQVKAGIQKRMEKNHATVGKNDRNVLASVLDTTLGNETDRHVVSAWLTGEASTKKMPDAAVRAMLDWQGVASFDQMPADYVLAETHACLEAANADNGQLPLVEGE